MKAQESPNLPAPLTEAYAKFASEAANAPLSARVAEIVRLGFCDCAGVMLAGLGEDVVGRLSAWVGRRGLRGGSRVLFGPDRTAPDAAAMVGAVAAHALDYDDYAFSNHPSAVLVPTILAASLAVPVVAARLLAEHRNPLSGW